MPDVVLKAYDLGHDVRATIASSYTLQHVSIGLNTRKRVFLGFLTRYYFGSVRYAKKTGRKFHWEVTTKRVAKFGGAPLEVQTIWTVDTTHY